MAHNMTAAAYKDVRDKTYTAIFFEKNGKRGLMYGGLNVAKLAQELSKSAKSAIIFSNENYDSWNREIMQWERENKGRISLNACLEIKQKYNQC